MEKKLFAALFAVIESITLAELTNTSKHLIINYYTEADGVTPADKARAAIIRYTQCKTLPLLEEMRRKTPDQLSKLEHLVLKLEFEAKKLAEL